MWVEASLEKYNGRLRIVGGPVLLSEHGAVVLA